VPQQPEPFPPELQLLVPLRLRRVRFPPAPPWPFLPEQLRPVLWQRELVRLPVAELARPGQELQLPEQRERLGLGQGPRQRVQRAQRVRRVQPGLLQRALRQREPGQPEQPRLELLPPAPPPRAPERHLPP